MNEMEKILMVSHNKLDNATQNKLKGQIELDIIYLIKLNALIGLQ